MLRSRFAVSSTLVTPPTWIDAKRLRSAEFSPFEILLEPGIPTVETRPILSMPFFVFLSPSKRSQKHVSLARLFGVLILFTPLRENGPHANRQGLSFTQRCRYCCYVPRSTSQIHREHSFLTMEVSTVISRRSSFKLTYVLCI